jgi:putative oxidoreductase
MTTSPVTFSPDESNAEATTATPLSDTIALVARILLTLPFLRSGLSKIFEFDATAGFMRAEGMPLVPLFLVGAIALEVLGGLSILAGYRARFGALALIVFLVPTTLIFHDFWTFTGQGAMMQRVSFFNNLGLLGGLALVAAFGSGAISVDAKTKE